ncbi:putative transposase [Acinetobacter sp. 72431]|nr:putative transposase [Acinetobacter sp. 72431]
MKLFSIELEQAVRGEIFLPILVNQTLFSNVLIVGQAAVSCLDYSN